MTIQWPQILNQATGYLQELLRIDTTNPPGNERAAIQWLANILRQAGLNPTIIEAAPGRDNLVCRIAGSGSSGPLLLSSHVDVVPAEAKQWTYPPFSGTISNGYIWGRGALDMKSMTIYQLIAMLLIHRSGIKPKRDLILAAVADEEYTTRYGSAFLVEQHPELIRAEYGLNESGGFTLHRHHRRIYPIQVGEKGICWVIARVKGTPGHGSKPHQDIVTTKLGEAIVRLRHHRLGYHLTPIAREFIRNLARITPGREGWFLRGLANPISGPWCARHLPANSSTAFLAAITHNTACITGVRSGVADSVNVIPSNGELTIDGRLLPGQTIASFLLELQQVLGPEFEIEIIRERTATVQERNTPLFATICAELKAADPGAMVTPFILSGFTDAHFYKKLGITMYGFQPLLCPPEYDIGAMAHSHDERIPLQGFHWGVRTFWNVVQNFIN